MRIIKSEAEPVPSTISYLRSLAEQARDQRIRPESAADMSPRHLALAVALAAVWGVNFVVMQVGLQHFPPLLYAGAAVHAGRLPRPARWWAAGRALAVGRRRLAATARRRPVRPAAASACAPGCRPG